MSQHDKGSSKQIKDLVKDKNFVERFNKIINLCCVKITNKDKWYPNGKDEKEKRLESLDDEILCPHIKKEIKRWWIPGRGNTPNWDLISTATINGKKGFILVEAKSHEEELKNNSLRSSNKENIENIKRAINKAFTKLEIKIDEENLIKDKYQLLNRIAFAWKLTTYGFPVILMYLGFINDESFKKAKIFKNVDDWEYFIKNKNKRVLELLDRKVKCCNGDLYFIIRSFDCKEINS